ncbi:unnamed protein product [Litomosoides sigmodontis]|uniref:Uncharacterized protein n=1 Tax=Litomosoides sigmodontis TaxID=42156 RepID=A0A3P6VBH9_LITSI|nr:unnamed protein product [Litomosoides sigmodontis]
MLTGLQSGQLSTQATPKQSVSSIGEVENFSLAPSSDPFYELLKQLPDKLIVQLPCGVIRAAAEHVKNISYNASARFIIFRTDLHPVIYLFA